MRFLDTVLDLELISVLHVIFVFVQKIRNLRLKRWILECVQILALFNASKKYAALIVGFVNWPSQPASLAQKKHTDMATSALSLPIKKI